MPREVAAGRQKSSELQVLVELTRRKDNEIQRIFTAERGKLGLGATVVFPFKGRHAVRGSFSTGVVTKSGGDYEMLSLSYIFAW